MESEKVKEIKKALECQSTLSLPKCEKCNYKFGIVCKTEKLLEDALTLINELESENERLSSRYRNLEINYNDTWEHYREYEVENQQLKDRIAELEKSKFCVNCTKEIQGREVFCLDCHEEVIKCALKQFAERLKEKLFDLGNIVNESDIDETLKEFVKGEKNV